MNEIAMNGAGMNLNRLNERDCNERSGNEGDRNERGRNERGGNVVEKIDKPEGVEYFCEEAELEISDEYQDSNAESGSYTPEGVEYFCEEAELEISDEYQDSYAESGSYTPDGVEYICAEDESGERLDVWLRRKTSGLSRSHIQRMIDAGDVQINGKSKISASYKMKVGDRALIADTVPLKLDETVVKEDIALRILYEDEHIIAIDKPKGMTVHPAAGVNSGTLVNALLWHCEGRLSDINGVIRPGIVHRLDRDTSGVIVAAKSNVAHLALSKAFSERRVKKEYNAIVCGVVKNNLGKIDLPIGRDVTNRKKMAVVKLGGRQAVTLFEVVERFNGYTWLKIDLLTGRTHQIRVHLAYIGHPVAGDYIYGSGQKKLIDCGQLLHSTVIELNHPVTGELMRFESPPPEYFTCAKDILASV